MLEKRGQKPYIPAMFSAKQIKEMMNTQPFRPFRLHMSDGSTYEIPNHDTAMVAQNSVEVGVNPDPDGVVERFVRCAIIHITRIEELQAA
jgi:hypothetical protein